MNDYITGKIVDAQIASNEKAVAVRNDETGAAAVEYGLLVAGIAVAVILVVFTLGDEIAEMFTQITTAINGR